MCMRRPRITLLFATLLLVFILPGAQAQMRGGHGGGGFRGGAPGGGFRGPMRGAGPVRSQVPRGGFSGGVWGGSHCCGTNWGVNIHFGNRPFHRRYYYPYGYYPYASYGYGYPMVYPYYGYDSVYSSYSSSYDNGAQQQQQYLNNQLSDLSSQVQQLRDENRDLRYDLEHPAPTAGPDRRIPESLHEPMPREPEGPDTIFIFKDGRRLESRNYAIIGRTLWILTEKRSEKIPISELDVDKTVQENEKRGVEFTPPPQPTKAEVARPEAQTCTNGCQVTRRQPLASEWNSEAAN
jgi:hypothetical protein